MKSDKKTDKTDKTDKSGKTGKIESALKKSPINYFSDLFIMAMVTAWIAVIIIMVIFAVYATVAFADTSVWSELGSLVSVPLTAGGAIWMVKNSVQHAIANYNGGQARMDFPRVDASEEIYGQEEPMNTGGIKEAGEDDPEG